MWLCPRPSEGHFSGGYSPPETPRGHAATPRFFRGSLHRRHRRRTPLCVPRLWRTFAGVPRTLPDSSVGGQRQHFPLQADCRTARGHRCIRLCLYGPHMHCRHRLLGHVSGGSASDAPSRAIERQIKSDPFAASCAPYWRFLASTSDSADHSSGLRPLVRSNSAPLLQDSEKSRIRLPVRFLSLAAGFVAVPPVRVPPSNLFGRAPYPVPFAPR